MTSETVADLILNLLSLMPFRTDTEEPQPIKAEETIMAVGDILYE